MKAVILAAGLGSRMGDLTKTLPKPLLKISGKTLLEHKLEILPPEIDEVIIVIGYLGDKIKEHIGSSYKGKKINYVVQETLNGTGGGLWLLRDILKGKFLVMMGDDIYCRRDILECLKYDWSVLVKEVNLKIGAKVELHLNGSLRGIVENVSNTEGVNFLTNTGFYVLSSEIFNYNLVKIPNREEYGLPQTLVSVSAKFPIKVVKSNFWIPITSEADLRNAEDKTTNK